MSAEMPLIGLSQLVNPIVEIKNVLLELKELLFSAFISKGSGLGGGGGEGNPVKAMGKSFKSLGSMFKGLFSSILGPFALLMDVVTPLLEPLMLLIEPFTMLGELISSKLYPFIVPLMDFLFEIVDGIGWLLDLLDPFIQAISDWLSENLTLKNVVNGIIIVIQWLSDKFKDLIDFFKGLGDAIKEGWDKFVGFFKNLWDSVVDALKTGFEKVKEFFLNLGKMIWDWIKQGFENILDFGKNLWDAITFWD